jgi:excisionase family DNA binding protein
MALTAVKEHPQPLKLLTMPQLMTIQQCAEFLQVKIDTLYTWTSNRKIPFRKVGGLLRFDRDEIVEWTKANR